MRSDIAARAENRRMFLDAAQRFAKQRANGVTLGNVLDTFGRCIADDLAVEKVEVRVFTVEPKP